MTAPSFIAVDLTALDPLTGRPPVVVMCLSCGALVRQEGTRLHEEFHGVMAAVRDVATAAHEQRLPTLTLHAGESITYGEPAPAEMSREELLARAQAGTQRTPQTMPEFYPGPPGSPPMTITRQPTRRVLPPDQPVDPPNPDSFSVRAENAEPDPLRGPIPPEELAEMYDPPDVRG